MLKLTRMLCALMMMTLVDCGSQSETQMQSRVGDESGERHSSEGDSESGDLVFDLQKTWRIDDKRCNGSAVAVKPAEAYRFDVRTFVRLSQVVDDDVRVCNAGDFYLIVMNSISTGDSGYEQTGWLRPMGRKQSCRLKENGIKSDHVVTTQEDAPKTGNPTDLVVRASDRSPGVQLILRGHPDCEDGTLELTLGS